MLYIKDDAGQSYQVSGNDRTSYESFINQVQKAQSSGRKFDFSDFGLRTALERYESGITSDSGRLGKQWF